MARGRGGRGDRRERRGDGRDRPVYPQHVYSPPPAPPLRTFGLEHLAGVSATPPGGVRDAGPIPTTTPNTGVDWVSSLSSSGSQSSQSSGQAIYDPNSQQTGQQAIYSPQQTPQQTGQQTGQQASGQTSSAALYPTQQTSQYQSVSPQTTESHPFYDPGSNYWRSGVGQPAPSALFTQPNTELHRTWSNQNPEGYYYAFLNHRGLGGLDARSQTAQSMYRDAMMGYQAAKLNNAELDLSDYLAQWDVERLLAQMTNEQLGIDDSRHKARNRWGMRAV